MARAARASRIAALADAALLVVACGPKAPEHVLAPGHKGAPGVKRVISTPVNLVLSLSDELEPTSEKVGDEIAAYLRSKGKEVTRLKFSAARRRWEASMQEVKSSGAPLGFESTARAFVLRPRDDLFEDPANLREGIHIAFDPYLPKPTPVD